MYLQPEHDTSQMGTIMNKQLRLVQSTEAVFPLSVTSSAIDQDLRNPIAGKKKTKKNKSLLML